MFVHFPRHTGSSKKPFDKHKNITCVNLCRIISPSLTYREVLAY